MLANESFLDSLIAIHHRAIRYNLIFALGLVVLGILVIVFARLFSGSLVPDVLSGLFSLGGGFISSLSAFQIKELVARKEKADMCKLLKVRLREANELDGRKEGAMRKRIDELVWQIVEKTAIG